MRPEDISSSPTARLVVWRKALLPHQKWDDKVRLLIPCVPISTKWLEMIAFNEDQCLLHNFIMKRIRNALSLCTSSSVRQLWLLLICRNSFLVKEEFLDVVYWSRQLVSAILGMIWASIPLNGILGIIM